MSDTPNVPDPSFFERTNALINVANNQCSGVSADQVSHSFTNASTRFNVWLWSITSKDVEDLKARREQALDLLLQETHDAFARHFDEYVANYDAYVNANR
ncbi:hypothetical protein AEAC466_20490 [Asticcacaulis sp. AC466]|uniref:DUF3144 domain-containing protein n=1 Tax=Asticcacaulis sp. AC466 TaxID=1282362 RepID=UPI0003C3C58D|nr:DUF3144 domain-containing protein [Asticcacaulis sp. AC466]ESQ81676.1 hypothetical protein AEAC466_20490 [Asticcacaulis sp. AC466]